MGSCNAGKLYLIVTKDHPIPLQKHATRCIGLPLFRRAASVANAARNPGHAPLKGEELAKVVPLKTDSKSNIADGP
jgi:hypothetical protein